MATRAREREGGLAALLRRAFSPPHFADEEQDRIARVLHVTLASGFAAAVLAAIAGAAAHQPGKPLTIVAGAVIILLLQIPLRLGRIRLTIFLTFLFVLVMVTILMVQSGGIHDLGSMLFPVIIACGGLLLRPREFLVIVGLSILSAFSVIVLEVGGWLHWSRGMQTSVYSLLTVTAIFLLAAVPVRLLANDLNRHTARLKESEGRLRRSNEDLQPLGDLALQLLVPGAQLLLASPHPRDLALQVVGHEADGDGGQEEEGGDGQQGEGAGAEGYRGPHQTGNLQRDDGYGRQPGEQDHGAELPRPQQQPAAGDDHRVQHRAQVVDAAADGEHDGHQQQCEQEGQEDGQAYSAQAQGQLQEQQDDGAGADDERLVGLPGRRRGRRRQGDRQETAEQDDVQHPGEPVALLVREARRGECPAQARRETCLPFPGLGRHPAFLGPSAVRVILGRRNGFVK